MIIVTKNHNTRVTHLVLLYRFSKTFIKRLQTVECHVIVWNKQIWIISWDSGTCTLYMRGSRKFSRRGSDSDNVYFFYYFFSRWEKIEDPNTTTLSGPPPASQRNAIYMVFRWRADDCPSWNAGSVPLGFQGVRTSIAKIPYIIVIVRGGGSGPPVPPSGSAHVVYQFNKVARRLK